VSKRKRAFGSPPGPLSTIERVPPDFLNSREDAILVWIVVGLAYVLRKDFRGIGGSFLATLRALLSPKLLLLFGSAALYVAALVYGASKLGLWHTSALKATIYWYVGTAVVLAGQAVTEGARDYSDFAGKVLRRVVGVTVLIEFIANVYALPLAVELVGVLLIVMFSGIEVVAQHDPATPPATLKFVDGVLIAIGLVYFGYFFIRVLSDLDGFLTRENAENFFVPPTLTLALIPFLFLPAWRSRREQENLLRRFRTDFNSPA
jgi:hypothetical protein